MMMMMNRKGVSYHRAQLLKRLLPLLEDGGRLTLENTNILSPGAGKRVGEREWELTAKEAKALLDRLWNRK